MIDEEELLGAIRASIADGEYGLAAALLETMTARDNLAPLPFELLGELYMGKGDFVLARQNFDNAKMLFLFSSRDDESGRRCEERSRLAEEARLEKEKIDAEMMELGRRKGLAFIDKIGTGHEHLANLFGQEETGMTDDDVGFQTRHVLHPYFGFIQRPGRRGDFYTNNFGFFQGEPFCDYPYNGENGDAFIVGIFGGSVAAGFSVSRRKTLEEALAGHPAVGGRSVMVLPFAQGAFEQPQALQVLSFFAATGQKFDLVINIDGFNECNGKRVNQKSGLSHTMPQWGVIRSLRLLFQTPQLGEEATAYLGEMLTLRSTIAKLKDERGPLSKGRLKKARERYLKLSKQAPAIDMGHKDDILILESGPRVPGDKLVEPSELRDRLMRNIVEMWAGCSEVMSAIAASRGACYIHCIQPNQYAWNKTLSAKEEEEFFTPKAFHAKSVELMYPLMLERGKALAERGIDFVDLTACMDGETDTVLTDNICHFNALGNQRLFDALLPHVLRRLDRP